jgi:hypothetical protein
MCFRISYFEELILFVVFCTHYFDDVWPPPSSRPTSMKLGVEYAGVSPNPVTECRATIMIMRYSDQSGVLFSKNGQCMFLNLQLSGLDIIGALVIVTTALKRSPPPTLRLVARSVQLNLSRYLSTMDLDPFSLDSLSFGSDVQ